MEEETSRDSEDISEDDPEKKTIKGKIKQKRTKEIMTKKSIEQSNQGISDDDYSQLLHDISEWYDGSDSISMLKVLYRDHVTDVYTLDKANKMRDLLDNLRASGNLSPKDLSILCDTINITKQFGFILKNNNLLPLFQNEISKFTPHRQKLVKLGMTLNEADVATLDGFFNTTRLKKYKDSWHLIRDLEHRREICEENIKSFIEKLKKLQLFSAVEALIEGNEEPSKSKRPKLNEGIEEPSTSKRPKLNEGNEEPSTAKRQKLNEVNRTVVYGKDDETYASFYNRLKDNVRLSNMFIRKNVDGDGNCFLYCIQDQFERLCLPNRSTAQLRADLVDYLRHLDEKDPLTSLIDDKYLDDLSKGGTFVDEVAVRGLSRILNHNFYIVTSQRKSTEQGYLVTKIKENSNPYGLMLFGQIGELHYISLGYGGSATGMGESAMSGHQQQQPPPARHMILPQQLQQPQAQIRNQSMANSLRLAVQCKHPMQSLQRPSPGIPSIFSDSSGLCDEDKVIREYLLSRQQRVCSTGRWFTPATWNTAYHLDIADMFTDLDLLKEGKNREKKDAKPTTLKEVLDIIKSTSARKVLIEGEGGIGKSTLLRYVAYEWSTEQSDEMFKGKIVFLVNIRDIDVGETILDAILKQIDPEDFHLETGFSHNPILIKRFIQKHSDIVLLLDGLDELKDGSGSPISIFKNEKMYKCKVILTSRSENLNEFVKYSNVHVKVKGFDSVHIEKYIKKHFAFFKKTELGDLLIEELSYNMVVRDMCKNPMLLLLVCITWEEKKHLPADKADLFKDIFRCILNRFIDKQAVKEKKISVFENTPKKFVKAMLLLGKCFCKSLKKNQLSINKRDLKGPQEMVALALKLGFVYEDTPNQKSDFEEIFTTPHKLIVESLVGFYLYKLCQTEMLENECSKGMEMLLKPLADNEWQMIRRSENFHMARVFTIGFLGAKSGIFLSHWITNDISAYHSLMTYLEFVKEEHMDTVDEGLHFVW
ncbi:uncharacterized protein LOC117116685 [Anneissia japonica]|uniref:uncharacterized protein LOC117116685 n=1 Tax=Anneissia japonica TaxID=1529436 RepID=UPI00142559F6|nr:uncharacterized protein LOC117116685 [Anneissia japonica]